MSESKIPQIKPTSKFGKKTRQFSVRLPEDMIEKIKEKKIDTGQILYDVIERGMNPYSDKDEKRLRPVINVYFESLCHKLVRLMVDRKIDASNVEFLPEERALVMDIVKGAQG